MAKVNKQRGDVLLTLGEHEFVLRGTMQNLAALQSALDVVGLNQTLELVGTVDPRALLEGVRCLAVEGDVSAIGDLSFIDHMNAIQKAILAAITGALEPDEGNVKGGTTTAP